MASEALTTKLSWQNSMVAMLVLAASCVTGFAQSPALSPPESPPCAPVMLDGKEVVRICWTLGTIKLERRAAGVSERLLQIARDPTAPPIRIHNNDGQTALLSGEQLVSVVFDGDAQRAGVTKDELAQRWTASFERAIQAYRDTRSTRNIVRGVLLALLILAGTIVLLIALSRATRHASRTKRTGNRSSNNEALSLRDLL